MDSMNACGTRPGYAARHASTCTCAIAAASPRITSLPDDGDYLRLREVEQIGHAFGVKMTRVLPARTTA